MDPQELLSRIDIERIYRHVLVLEGERHPLRSPDRLRRAADYIRDQLQAAGVKVREQEFEAPGWKDTFRNIAGILGDEDSPAAVLIGHYDSYLKSAGANDNAAAVGVLLELARVLAKLPKPPAVRFAAVSLEETNPALQSQVFQSAQDCGVMDGELRHTSWEKASVMQRFWGSAWTYWKQGSMSYSRAMAQAIQQFQESAPLPEQLLRHMKDLERIHDGILVASGSLGHLGSHAWVNESMETGRKIKYAICLDEIGTTNHQEGSQRLFPGLSYEMLQLYKVEPEKRIGNWAFIVTDQNAFRLGQAFCGHCTSPQVNLPYAYMPIPMQYEQILQFNPQALGSDYVPFWKAGIPALALIDTAALRNPYGHSMADTIDRLDFDQIGRIARATLATLLDPAAG